MNSVAPFQMVMVLVAENTLLRNIHKDPVCLFSWCMKPSRNGVLGFEFQANLVSAAPKSQTVLVVVVEERVLEEVVIVRGQTNRHTNKLN
jgi:hypothetical protein